LRPGQAEQSYKADFARERNPSPVGQTEAAHRAYRERCPDMRDKDAIRLAVTMSSAADRRNEVQTRRHAFTPSRKPVRTVKFFFTAYQHYREY